MQPTLAVLTYSALAALSSGVGAVPVVLRRRMPASWLGWANAVAAGLMLGAAYVLMAAGMGRAPAAGAGGAVVGILLLHGTHAAGGTHELDLNRLGDPAPDYGYRLLFVNTLHTAPEGIAIGIAMMLSASLGGFMALAIAVHNVPEVAVLASVLASRGLPVRRAVGAATATVGALLYLVMAELLPHCYRQAGHTSIALVTILAMGIVVLLEALR
jgi:ZIP family zinc transporter